MLIYLLNYKFVYEVCTKYRYRFANSICIAIKFAIRAYSLNNLIHIPLSCMWINVKPLNSIKRYFPQYTMHLVMCADCKMAKIGIMSRWLCLVTICAHIHIYGESVIKQHQQHRCIVMRGSTMQCYMAPSAPSCVRVFSSVFRTKKKKKTTTITAC